MSRLARAQQRVSEVRAPALLAASAVFVATALVAPVAGSGEPQPVPTVPPQLRAEAAAPTPTPVPLLDPERIVLPKLGVDAPVVPVGVEADGAMGTPGNARDVAWWQGTKAGTSNALFAGHRDWSGARGSFYSLQSLSPGDEIHVVGQGQQLTFAVQWVRQVGGDSSEAPDILAPTEHPAITLITCGGVFDRSIRHYTDRVIARAVLV